VSQKHRYAIKGEAQELYTHAWGDPYKETEIGQALDQFEVTD
jgi:hypothetical protein